MSEKSYKEQLLEYVEQEFFDDAEYSVMIAEIYSFSEERCYEELTKMAAFAGFAEQLKAQMAEAGPNAQLADMPIVKAENAATQSILNGSAGKSVH